jgi:NAD-dependent deacetylase
MTEEAVRTAAQLIRSAHFAIALTGAGISTTSGIPDFRSRDSGLWEKANPAEIASIFGFKRHPEVFYNWIRPLARLLLEAQPNAAHLALAQLEAAGFIKAIITQNIDMLHTRAGAHTVYEVHGHLRTATCIECYTEYDAEPIIRKLLENGEIPRCPQCHGVLKPNVILYGEQLPVRELFAAQQAARRCDLMLVAGSSLQVAPAGDMPLLAKQHGAKLIIVNFEPTHVDRQADVLFHDNVVDVLPRIAAAVMEDG